MKIESIIKNVQTENLYNQVLQVEGEKHPIDSPEELNACADYILSEFEKYGLKTNDQEFTVDGFDATFRNIEGILGNGSNPELVIVSHYDTVPGAPGANDNGSAIAVMLESARVLAESEYNGCIRFVSFSLEEANPVRTAKIRELAQKSGIRTADLRITSWQSSMLLKEHIKLMLQLMQGRGYHEAAVEALEQIKDRLNPNELEYLQGLVASFEGITPLSWIGQVGLMGSNYWVDEALRTQKDVLGVICLDTIGYTSSKKNSQEWPDGIETEMLDIYGTSDDLTIGDFLAVIGDKNSQSLAKSFCEQSKNESIGLPYACLQEDFSYEQAAYYMRDILRSDHAPFWRANIPGLFLTDTGEFRFPYYHTPADTIDRLDFNFIGKICKAIVATAIDCTQ
ncbi:MAG: M28 family peptidase [Candidatus Thorarchaeota archaeon]